MTYGLFRLRGYVYFTRCYFTAKNIKMNYKCDTDTNELDNDQWPYEEELKLLDAMIINGPDNWEYVSKYMKNRNAHECKKYYLRNFILNPKSKELINILKNANDNFNKHCNSTTCGDWLNIDFKNEENYKNIPCTSVQNDSSCDSIKNEYLNEPCTSKTTIFNKNNDYHNIYNAKNFIKNVKTENNDNLNIDDIKQEFDDNSNKSNENLIDGNISNKIDLFKIKQEPISEEEEDNDVDVLKNSSKIKNVTNKRYGYHKNRTENTKYEWSVNNNKNALSESENIYDLNGYNINRDEFDVEFDDNAEEVLMCLRNDVLDDRDKDNDLLKELSYVIIEGYNDRLSERIRRKRIIRHYELYNPLKAYSWHIKYRKLLGETLMKNLMCLLDPEEFTKVLLSLNKINELKTRLKQYLHYRFVGLTKLSSIGLYEHLNKERNEQIKRLNSVPTVSFFNLGLPLATSTRRSAPPIEIKNMPGHSKLDESESEFCSVNRILPNSYLQFKDILMNECQKRNGIKLAQARMLIKIDVNKTRKIFDLLVQKQVIWLPVAT